MPNKAKQQQQRSVSEQMSAEAGAFLLGWVRLVVGFAGQGSCSGSYQLSHNVAGHFCLFVRQGYEEAGVQNIGRIRLVYAIQHETKLREVATSLLELLPRTQNSASFFKEALTLLIWLLEF